ncbi:MAG: YlxR family protein [Ruminococcaceae bacterium]|nr:YlxR family protein [Oscillospiraceae bacterium]
MAKTGPKPNKTKERKVPERRCTGCGGTFPKKELIRVVRAPEAKPDETGSIPAADAAVQGRVSVDFTGKKAGRGAYLCKKEACLSKARKAGRLHSSLQCEITDEVYEELAKEIRLAEAENDGGDEA